MRHNKKLIWVICILGSTLLGVLILLYCLVTIIGSNHEAYVPISALDQLKSVIVVLMVFGVFFFVFTYRYLSNKLALNMEGEHEAEPLVDYSSKIHSLIEHPENVSIYSIDRQYCYTGFNSLHKEEMSNVFGQEAGEGRNILELLPVEMAHRAQINYDRALRGDHFQVTSMFMDKYFTQVFNPVLDHDDKVVGVTCTIFDVTERIKAEQELESYKDQLEELVRDRTRQLERQTMFFQEIIDSLPNLIFVRDKRSRYVLVNKAMAESFDKKTGELIGKSVLETHYDKKEALRYEEEDREIVSYNEIIEQESFHRYKNGTGKWLFLSKRRMKVFDDEYVLGVHFDINNLKETELKLLEANQELKNTLSRLKSAQMRLIESEKMASLGQLTAGLAHEINNPINYVAGNVSPIRRDLRELKEYVMALQKLPDGDYNNGKEKIDMNFMLLFDELESLLDGVDEGTSRVKNLMSDLNAFSLPDTSRKQPCDINDSLSTTLNLVKHHLKNRVNLEVNLNELPLVFCNAQQISQVFLNIINNAIQAIEGEGTIQVSSRAEEDQVVVAIEDTGTGISEANLSKIFNPFFTTKDVGEGTGLGLAISYRIIEEHKGSIEVSSEVGEGTKFQIILPLADQS